MISFISFIANLLLLLFQVGDLLVNVIVIVRLVCMVAPDGFGQGLLVDDPHGAGHEVVQDMVFFVQQFQGPAVHIGSSFVRKKFNVACLQGFFPALPPAELALDTGYQFAQIERLGQIVVRA